MKHTWKLNEYGERDDFALEEGFHNGPACTVCGMSFCKHCTKNWAELECEGP